MPRCGWWVGSSVGEDSCTPFLSFPCTHFGCNSSTIDTSWHTLRVCHWVERKTSQLSSSPNRAWSTKCSVDFITYTRSTLVSYVKHVSQDTHTYQPKHTCMLLFVHPKVVHRRECLLRVCCVLGHGHEWLALSESVAGHVFKTLALEVLSPENMQALR